MSNDSIPPTTPNKLHLTDDDKKEFSKHLGLTTFSITTMYWWLNLLGFRYKDRKKYYFVNSHGKEDTKQYRKDCVKIILKLEQRMYRWV